MNTSKNTAARAKNSTAAAQANKRVVNNSNPKVMKTRKWTREALIEEAKKYDSKKEFRKNNGSAYNAMYDNFREEFNAAFEGKGNRTWSREALIAEAANYDSKKDFAENNRSAYSTMRNKFRDDLNAVFDGKGNMVWTREALIAEAKNYDSKKDFEYGNPSACAIMRNKYREDYDAMFINQRIYKADMLKMLAESADDIEKLSDIDLLSFIALGVFPKKFEKLVTTSKPRKAAVEELIDEITESDEEYIEDEIDETSEEEVIDEAAGGEESGSTEEAPFNDIIEEESEAVLEDRRADMISSLRAADRIMEDNIDRVADGQTSRALIQSKLAEMWNLVLDGVDYKTLIADLREGAGKWLTKIIDSFEGGYKEVETLTIPAEYGFPYAPNLMQKLMAHSVMHHDNFGNWSGPGAGKTNSFLLAASVTNRKMIVVVCPNSVVSTITRSVDAFFNDSIEVESVVINSMTTLKNFVPTADRTFVVVNYEKFQQEPTDVKNLISDIAALNPDMLVFDEIHRAKEEARMSTGLNRNLINLRKACAANKDLKVLGMTATPLVNKVVDVRYIMELLMGTEYTEIVNNNKSVRNCIRAYQALLINGFRYLPKYPMTKTESIVKIHKSIPFDADIYKMLTSKNSSKWCELDKMLAKIKFDMITDQKLINPGRTIVYTNYVSEVVDSMKEAADEKELTYYTWTGEEKEEDWQLADNVANKQLDRDIMIGSKPISTGVDGLQKVCDTIIILSMPYTYADYEQLVGRVYRQGSAFKNANIIRLNVTMESPKGATIDLDQRRFEIVDNKKNLYKAVVDGEIKRIFKYEDEDAKKMAKKASKKIKDGEAMDEAFKRDVIK